MKPIIILITVIIVLFVLSNIRHWESNKFEGNRFTLGYIGWDVGKFPNHYKLIIKFSKNVDIK